jgi:hypothetical protein
MNRMEDRFKNFILYKGGQWAVPIGVNFAGVFYNKGRTSSFEINQPRRRDAGY